MQKVKTNTKKHTLHDFLSDERASEGEIKNIKQQSNNYDPTQKYFQ